MKKRDLVEGLEELWGKERLPADFREFMSAPETSEAGEDYEELEGFEDDGERRQVRRLIRALEELWGEDSLPADFRELVSPLERHRLSRASGSSRVLSLTRFRNGGELLRNSVSFGSLVAACLILVLSLFVGRDDAGSALEELTTTVNEGFGAVLEGQVDLRDATYRLAWVTTELARSRRDVILASSAASESDRVELRKRFELAAGHFMRVLLLQPDREVRVVSKYNAALAYQEACRFEEAGRLLNELLSEEGTGRRAEFLYALGTVHQMTGDYFRATLRYKEAFEQAVAEGDERVQESAAFNQALAQSALYAAGKDPRHLKGALEALESSVERGGRERVIKIRRNARGGGPSSLTLCSGPLPAHDLTEITEEPDFREFLQAQEKRWL